MPTETLHPYITKDKIDAMIGGLAEKISSDYAGKLSDEQELLVVVTLKGALFFGADLVRKLTVPCRVDFVRLSSYGAGTKSSGTVRIIKDIESQPQGEHVLVIDEIVDSGRTVDFLVKRLKATGPASVKVCSLLSKPSRREVEVGIDYLGADVEDKFLVGYGLDYGERYRNLKDICYLQQT
jgi:hypoxanthine phosphoribosyltransferase